MPKVSRVGKFRATAKASLASSPLASGHLVDKSKNEYHDVASPSSESQTPLSRGQRKRMAKREQYLKREKMIMSSLRLQRLEQQKGKIDGLDAIREALPSFASIRAADKQSKSNETPPKILITNKSKQTLASTEVPHMGLVLEHPAFKENPFAAIQQHLRNTLAPQAEKLKRDTLEQTKQGKKIEAMKKEERKERIRDAKFSTKRSGHHKQAGTAANRKKR